VPGQRAVPSRAGDPLAAFARGAPGATYLLHGDESYLIERALAGLRDRITSAARILWAPEDAARLPAALDDLASPMLFGGSQVLVIRRAEALSAKDEELVLAAAGRVQPPACLILVARGLDGRRRVLAAFERAGAAFAFPRVTEPATLREWIGRLAGERGQEIRPAAVDLLLERMTPDLATLASEIEKASLYAGAGVAIDVGHLEAVAALGRTAAVEALADRLARRDLRGAHRALAGLLGAGEPPVRMVAFLAASLRRALHVAELAGEGLGQDAIAARLGIPGWLVRRVQSSRSARQLERSLAALRDLDLALKTSRPAAAAFTAALTEMTGGREGEGASASRRP
jgi:DNA polymerase-3 subunit delta